MSDLRWWDVLCGPDVDPHDLAVFEVLTPNDDIPWKTVPEIVEATGLPIATVKGIIARHAATGLIVTCPTWPGYYAEQGFATPVLMRLEEPRTRSRVA